MTQNIEHYHKILIISNIQYIYFVILLFQFYKTNFIHFKIVKLLYLTTYFFKEQLHPRITFPISNHIFFRKSGRFLSILPIDSLFINSSDFSNKLSENPYNTLHSNLQVHFLEIKQLFFTISFIIGNQKSP